MQLKDFEDDYGLSFEDDGSEDSDDGEGSEDDDESDSGSDTKVTADSSPHMYRKPRSIYYYEFMLARHRPHSNKRPTLNGNPLRANLAICSSRALRYSQIATLARLLDNPSIPWKSLLIGFSLGQFALESYLSFRQYKCLSKKKPPKALEAEITQEKFDKSQEYGRAKARFGFVAGLYDKIQNVLFIYHDAFPKMWSVAGLVVSRCFPARFSGEIGQSLVFLFMQNIL
ncbi:hypothetical protein KEM54_003963, partial [Ascosphaera aggregata]